jgi:hypothetical protein
MTCPSCEKDIICLNKGDGHRDESNTIDNIKFQRMIFPDTGARQLPSGNVPDTFKNDYIEAAKVLHLSEKASAALSRRCLQNIIHNHLNVRARDLNAEIQLIRDQGKLPSDIVNQLDSLREIGNFSAHPKKDALTNEIIDVDTGEAEWALEILDEIFDYCFDRPARIAARKATWNSKKDKTKKQEG